MVSTYYRDTRLYRPNITIAATTYLGVTLTFFLAQHFFLRGGYLTLFYYQSYLIPAAYLALIVLIGEMILLLPKPVQLYILYGLVPINIGLWFLTRFNLPAVSHVPFIAFAAISLITLLLIVAACNAGAAIGVSIIVSLSPFAFYSAGNVPLWQWVSSDGDGSADTDKRVDYIKIQSGSRAILEEDVYEGALFLANVVSELQPELGPVGFWYGSEPNDVYLNSIQSMYLWEYSRVFPPTNGMGMPVIDAAVRKSIENKKFLVLLGRNDNELKAGLNALSDANLPYRVLESMGYEGKRWSYRMIILEVLRARRDTGPELAEIPLSTIRPFGGQVTQGDDGTAVMSPVARWSYAASAPIPAKIHNETGPLLLHIKMMVSSGAMGVSIADTDNIESLVDEVSVPQSSAFQDELH